MLLSPLFISLNNHLQLSSHTRVLSKVKTNQQKKYICIHFEGAVLTFKSMRVYAFKNVDLLILIMMKLKCSRQKKNISPGLLFLIKLICYTGDEECLTIANE